MTGDSTARRTPRRCPICARVVPPGRTPFCSDRCASVDLGRWLNGDYAIPVRPADAAGHGDDD